MLQHSVTPKCCQEAGIDFIGDFVIGMGEMCMFFSPMNLGINYTKMIE